MLEAIADDRVTLRPWELSDLPDLEVIAARWTEHVAGFMPSAAAELREPERFLATARRGWDDGTLFAFAIVVERTVVGHLSLTPARDQPRAELGYWIVGDRTGEGFATGAVRLLVGAVRATAPALRQLVIHCDAANVASAHVAQKSGFRLVERHAAGARRTGAQSGVEMTWVRDLGS